MLQHRKLSPGRLDHITPSQSMSALKKRTLSKLMSSSQLYTTDSTMGQSICHTSLVQYCLLAMGLSLEVPGPRTRTMDSRFTPRHEKSSDFMPVSRKDIMISCSFLRRRRSYGRIRGHDVAILERKSTSPSPSQSTAELGPVKQPL